MHNPAADAILSLYQRHAEAFVRLRSRSLFEQGWLDKFRAVVGPMGPILDLGCGTGQPIAGYFIAHGYPITGVDGASAMLAHASAAFPEQRWLQRDMRELALDETFSGIIAWDCFFHLTAQAQHAMFPIFARHSRPGSALMFTSGTRHGIAMGQFEGEPLFHASLDPEEYRTLLAENGFVVCEMTLEDPHCTGHTIWLAQYCETASPE